MSSDPVKTLSGQIATLFGLGRAVKKAPGTAGSAAAAAAALFIPFWPRIVLIAVLFTVGIWAAGAYEKNSGRHDPGEVIIDEAAGQLIATLWHVAGTGFSAASEANFVIPAFILFRFFDILKPWPVCACEKAPGGLGIMLDDAAAGIFANAVLWGLRKVFIEGWWPF
jgi:phosphatidylglycerophosphatase A